MRRLLSFVSMGLIAVVILSGCNEKNIDEHDKYKDGTTVTEKESGNEKEHRDDIVFANEDLENMVREIIEKTDGEITKEDLEKVTYLGIDNAGLKDISVLKHMTNLQELDLRENEIVDITPLASLSKLKELSLNGNKILDITPLEELTFLDLEDNAITDITSLKNKNKLNTLYLKGNNIDDFSTTEDYYDNLEWKDFS